MNKYNIVIFGLLIILLIGCSENNNVKEKLIKETTDLKLDIDTNGVSLNYLNNFFERKTLNPRDRSLAKYLKSNPNRPDSIRNIIYLLPLGHMSSEIEEIIKQDTLYYQYFFQLKVKVLQRVPFNDLIKNENIKTREIQVDNYGKGKGEIENEIIKEQIDAKSLTDYYIIPNKPKDAVAILGITDHDIYSEKYNFLYGSSNIKNGAGVISTHRIKSYKEITQSNIRKVVSKQIVNLFSIKNVKDYYCLLNFHNGMDDLRAGTYYISPRAQEKLKMNIGFDYNERFQMLLDFWKIQENVRMINHYYKCLGIDSVYTRTYE